MKKLFTTILWIRQGIFYVYLYAVLTLFALIHTLMYLCSFPYFIRTRSAQINSFCVIFGMKLILWIKCEIQGKENLPKQACIYVSKHQSEWETFYFPSFILRTCFVAKKEILQIPILGMGLKSLEYIPIDRSQGLKALKNVISEGKNRLKRNISIVIFPEGTRVAPKENPKFHKSAMSLAKSNNVPIVPIAHNSGSIWPASPRKKLIKPGKITVIIGKPIQNNGEISLLTDESYNWIKNTMSKIE